MDSDWYWTCAPIKKHLLTYLCSTIFSYTLGITEFLGSLKICPCEERRLKETQNLKCEDKRFQNFPVLKTEDLATKPTKPED